MALRRPTDSWIARHVRHRLSGQRAKTHVAAQSSRRIRGLDAGMPRADHDHVKGRHASLADTESLEDPLEDVVGRARADDLVEAFSSRLQIE
jgi:hypothetical protein